MQKGRRETFAEKLGSWDLINGRPLEGSSVTGKGHTHTHTVYVSHTHTHTGRRSATFLQILSSGRDRRHPRKEQEGRE